MAIIDNITASPSSALGGFSWDGALIGIILILIGSMESLYGFRLIRVTMAACGFLLFSAISSIIVLVIDANNAAVVVNTWQYVLLFIAMGLVGAVIGYFLWHVGIVMIGAFGGFALTSYILTLSGNPQILALHIALPIILDIGGVVLAVLYPRPVVIVSTSIGGALAFTSGLASLFGVRGSFGTTVLGYVNGKVITGQVDTSYIKTTPYIILLVVTVIVAAIGAAFQFGFHLQPSARKWVGDHLGRLRQYEENKSGVLKTILGLHQHNGSYHELEKPYSGEYVEMKNTTSNQDNNLRMFEDAPSRETNIIKEKTTTRNTFKKYLDSKNWWTVKKTTLSIDEIDDEIDHATSPMLQSVVAPKKMSSPLTTMPNRKPMTPPTTLYDGVITSPQSSLKVKSSHPRDMSLASVYNSARDHKWDDDKLNTGSDSDVSTLDYGSVQERYPKRNPLPDFSEGDVSEEPMSINTSTSSKKTLVDINQDNSSNSSSSSKFSSHLRRQSSVSIVVAKFESMTNPIESEKSNSKPSKKRWFKK